MNPLLAQINKEIRKSISPNDNTVDPCAVWSRSGFLHISVNSTGCRFHAMGYCTMCDYGRGSAVQSEDIFPFLNQIWNQNSEPINELLIGSNGSIFDTQEVSRATLDEIFRFIVLHPVPTVIFETHYETVSRDILDKLKSELSQHITDIVIELGLESADSYILDNCLNKRMDLQKLHEKIALIKSYGFSVVLNVFLGTPFLTPAQQLSDTMKTLIWAADNGADHMVVFPANIKSNTLIGFLHREGKYERPSAWLLVELLKQMPEELIGKIGLSWYGDRQRNDKALGAIPPKVCDICKDIVLDFFDAYNVACDVEKRKLLVRDIITSTLNCTCYSNCIKLLKLQQTSYIQNQVKNYHDYLKQVFNVKECEYDFFENIKIN